MSGIRIKSPLASNTGVALCHFPREQGMLVEPGSLVGRYEVHRKLGRGGMGTVYVAHDPVLGRMVAIKMFSTDVDMPDAGSRFAREARSAAALSHPNIVTVYDFGDFDGQPYIVMEYVAGETLSQVIRRKSPVPLIDKLRWVEELLAGVSYAHRMSMVHRDIKPANLMIDKSGRLKILDFGIARMVGTASNTGVMLGTPGYMAPEQIKGDAVDHRADVFAIGVVLYELMAYSEAFPGEMAPTIIHRVLNDEPKPLTEVAPDTHAEVVSMCERALRKNPEERFDTAAAMRDVVSRLRREIEAESGATIIQPYVPSRPAVADPSRPSGPASRDSDRGSGRTTPKSGPRRTDREVLARRRAELLANELQSARSLLQQENFEGAREACLRALAIDESCLEALELERLIESEIASFEPASAGSMTSAMTMSEQTGVLPLEVADDPTILRLGSDDDNEDDKTVYRALPTPTPTPTLPPTSMPSARPTASGAIVAPPVARAETQAPATPAVVSQPAPGRSTSAPARPAPQRKSMISTRSILLGGGVALVAILAAGFAFFGRSAPTPGQLVIDAVPWATITSIKNESGEAVALPTTPSTPIRLDLPAGSYRIALTGPAPGLKRTEIKATVTAGAMTTAPATTFESLTTDQYFGKYLSASDDPAEPAAPGESAVAEGTQP